MPPVNSPVTIKSNVSVDQTAYDLTMAYALRSNLVFLAAADVRPTRQSMNGAAVVFTITSDLSAATTALNESTDLTPVAMSDSQVTVTLAEYGNAVVTSAAVRGQSFIVPYDAVVSNVINYNARLSFDTLNRDVLKAGSNVRYATGGTTTTPTARNTVEPEDTLAAADVRRARADLVGANVVPFGQYYNAVIHPDVTYDLRSETGSGSWRVPHEYASNMEIWTGEIGNFEGFRFIETDRAPIFADAGSSTTLTDVYATIFTGRECLARAWSMADGNGPIPRVVVGPVTDTLNRFRPIGWYWQGGHSIYRPASVRRVESSSSIGSNS